ncbi:hypothetical protein B1K96_15905 [Escherichia coli]|nr:hypothetical protein B1K96_15905 [Escherichia coli]
MKNRSSIQYMTDGNECFVSRYVIRHNHYVTYIPEYNQFYIQIYQDNGGINDIYSEIKIPDYSTLSEEELFQESTVSTEDVYKIIEYQKVLKYFHEVQDIQIDILTAWSYITHEVNYVRND